MEEQMEFIEVERKDVIKEKSVQNESFAVFLVI